MLHALQRILDDFCCGSTVAAQFADAILYTPDSTRRFLEPRFYSTTLKGSRFFPIDINEGQPLSGLVSHAFQAKSMRVSLSPIGDDRIGPTAKKATEGYRFVKSLIAIPILPVLSEYTDGAPLAVLLLHTRQTLTHDPQECDVYDTYRHNLASLAAVVSHLEAGSNRRYADALSQLSSVFLTSIRPVLPPESVFQRFNEFCRAAFRSELSFFSLGQDGEQNTKQLIAFCTDSNLTDDFLHVMSVSSEHFHQIDSDSVGIVLNYGHESEELSATLQAITKLASPKWLLLRRQLPGGSIGLAAVARSSADATVWDATDISLLNHTIAHFQLLFGRAIECEHILRSLDRVPPSEVTEGLSESQFQAVAYIARDFLNMDQVLVCSVRRTERGLAIRGLHADGFGKNGENELLKLRTQRELAFASASTPPPFSMQMWSELSTGSDTPDADKLDLMALIAHMYFFQTLQSRPPSAFRVNHTSRYRHFKLDSALAADCHIVGDVLFLPCVSRESDGAISLRAILVLASSTGCLQVDGREQVSQNLAAQIASAMASDETIFVEERMRRIRATSPFSLQALQCIAEKTSIATRAMVARIWLRIDLVSMLIGRPVRRVPLSKAIQRYLQCAARSGHWKESPAGVRMVCSFLGIAPQEFENVGWSATEMLAQQILDHLYFPVAHWDAIEQSTKDSDSVLSVLFRDLDSLDATFRRESDDEMFCITVDKVCERLYIPGHGLTGWCIRHCSSPVRLESLSKQDVAAVRSRYSHSISGTHVKAVDRTILRELPIGTETSLRSPEVSSPVSSQHVRDHVHKVREPLDTFMCVPFGLLEPLEYPRGIVRVALSCSPSGRFGDGDEMRLTLIASHLTEILMATLFRWERIAAKYDVASKLQGFLAHRLKRFGQDAAQLRALVESTVEFSEDIRIAANGIEIVARTVDRLEATRQFLRGLAFDEDEDLTSAAVTAYVVHWFQQHSYGVEVNVHDASATIEPRFPARGLIDLCLLVDEIVFNACIHSVPPPRSFGIEIRVDSAVLVSVVESCCPAGVFIDETEQRFEPYRDFLKRSVYSNRTSGKRGQGSSDIEAWEESLNVIVFCAMGSRQKRQYRIEGCKSGAAACVAIQQGEQDDTTIV